MNFKIVCNIFIGAALLMLPAAFTPVSAHADQAGTQTAGQEGKPAPDAEALVCTDCHRAANINTNEGVIAVKNFCLDCHQKEDTHTFRKGQKVNLTVTAEMFNKNQPRHQYIACINCHTDVARSHHKSETGAVCLECHTPHGEGTANAPHLRVACQACHFQSGFVRLDPGDFGVKLAHVDGEQVPVSLAGHVMADDAADKESCRKCHVKNNPVGAPAAVLPSKSILCIVCHTSPLSAGHPVFSLAGLIFLAGMTLMVGFWYKGSIKGEEASLHKKIAISSESVWNSLFSKQIFSLIKVFILDIIFQKRILKESVSRWSMHSLIFSAILLRLCLSLFTAVGYYFNPESTWMTALIDKNHGFTAFVNDLLGLFILIGIVWAAVKRFVVKPDHVVSEHQDTAALVILGGLVGFGFFLEGVRIHATGISSDMAAFSFAGYLVSGICSVVRIDWNSVYPILWWIHGLMAAVFIAYIPFGKMKHLFNTPLTYFIEEVDGVKNKKRV